MHLPHVLHIASGDLWAGAEVQLFTLAKSLNELHVPVSVALMNHGALEHKLLNAGLDVLVIDETKNSALKIIFELTKLIRKKNADVIHTHRIKENIIGSVAALLAGRTPSIRTVHGVPEQDPGPCEFKKQVIHFINRMSGRLLQKRIISVSEELSGLLARHYKASKITVIQNGIDTNIGSAGEHTQTVDNEHAVFRIGLAGRLVAIKRVDLLIRTAHHIMNQNPDLQTEFTVYGDGPMRQELELLSSELGVERTVNFAGHQDNIYGAIAGLDALLMTSDSEGLPMILLEAMAMKIPIVAHAAGGIPTLLDKGSCGILVYDHSPLGYASGIQRIATDPELRARITENAWQRVNTHYSARRNARQYLNLYLEIYQPLISS